MPSWLSFYSSNLLLSLQGVQQPCEDPSVDSSSITELKEFFSSVPICTLTQCPPGRVIQNSSEILSSSELTTEFFFCALLALLNAHLAELYRTQREFLSATVSLLHSLAS
jgi:hypothetical protein